MISPRTALILVAVFAMNAAAAAEYKPSEVIVKYKSGVTRTRANMNLLYSATGVKSVRRYSGIMKGFEHLYLANNVSVEDAVAQLNQNPNIEYAQPNYILRIQPVVQDDQDPVAGVPCPIPGFPFPPGCEDPSEPAQPARPALQPAPAPVIPGVVDPGLSKAYGLSKIGATEAWKEFKGAKNFIVAVIDTGIDYNHEDLSFNVWRNPNPTQDDVVGYDFIHNDGLPYDDQGHGTHTAGTVGAVGDNGKGVSGVAQNVSVMSVKFLDDQGSGTTADAVRGIDYAIAQGAKVLSNSWGGPADEGNPALLEAIERARAKDVLFVAAAGNEANDNEGSNPSYPAAFTADNMISVAATDSKDEMASFSNYGKTNVHLGAPGVRIYSTAPGNQYKTLSGTSMACPHVAGAAALLWAKNPTWNYKKVKEVLLGTVDKVSSLEGKTLTGGRLNVLKALHYRD